MATSPVFNGTNIFLSRSLVPPELFDALHDALRLNGAQIFLCCDPSRAGPHDYHVISSMDHEKFEDLRAKGCSLVGPQCIFSCAKEHRSLPKQGYTCCLAMDGAKVLASGFEKDEKVQIEKLVNAMGGVLHPKASLEVTFVIAKSVLAAKYKVKKETLLDPKDLKHFQNHSSQMAALDYLVSVGSDTFIPTYDGNMAKVVEGHRRYLGYKKSVLLDRRKLVELLDLHRNGTMTWDEFVIAVQEAHTNRMGQPSLRKVIVDKPKEEDYFYANPSGDQVGHPTRVKRNATGGPGFRYCKC